MLRNSHSFDSWQQTIEIKLKSQTNTKKKKKKKPIFQLTRDFFKLGKAKKKKKFLKKKKKKIF